MANPNLAKNSFYRRKLCFLKERPKKSKGFSFIIGKNLNFRIEKIKLDNLIKFFVN
jgi:hypothetical protein